MRKRLIAGNWKLNGDWQLCQQFISDLAAQKFQADTVICPPAVYIMQFARDLAAVSSNLRLGGQNVSVEMSGAFTGELSAQMLKEAGAHYCIVGHSERRELFAETDLQVSMKARCLIASALTPIVCVGENLAQRDSGNARSFVELQLRSLGDSLPADMGLDQLVIAYEPIWAIGTGKTASPAQVEEMHAHIRLVMANYGDSSALRILYGGSVKPDNAAELLAIPDVDGALIGGASLNVTDFEAIAAVV